MKHAIAVTSVKLSDVKQYLVKRYSNGDYYINQSIMGRVFYRSWTKTTARYAKSLLLGFHGETLPHLTLTIKPRQARA